jgi:hypothetical protein
VKLNCNTHTHTQTHTDTHRHIQIQTHTDTYPQEKTGKKEVDIYLNNNILKQVNSIKYLGIIFESKMSFREHINYVGEK